MRRRDGGETAIAVLLGAPRTGGDTGEESRDTVVTVRRAPACDTRGGAWAVRDGSPQKGMLPGIPEDDRERPGTGEQRAEVDGEQPGALGLPA